MIGPIGRAARIAGGLAAITVPISLSGITWWDVAVALLLLPLTAAVTAAVTTAEGPWIRSSVALVAVIAVEVAVSFVTPLDGSVALWIFLGISLIIAALRGDAGCEAVAIPNALSGRTDPAGCMIYAPVDALEARRRRKRAAPDLGIHAPVPLEVVLGWLDAMRRGDLHDVARWFDPHVTWHGVRRDAGTCRNRDEVLEMLHGTLEGNLGANAVEVIAGDGAAVLGAKVPGLAEIGGVDVRGQLFNVFRVGCGRIVAVEDYALRDEALAAAGAKPPQWS